MSIVHERYIGSLLLCSGDGSDGRLGLGNHQEDLFSDIIVWSPTEVPGIAVVDVCAGGSHTVAHGGGDLVYSWGSGG